jgi:OmcA/MtrC family decaheme c-type cytochrome
MGFAAASLLAVALAGCGSSGGGGDIVAVTPPPPAGGGAPTVAVPTGTAPITLTSATPAATFAALPLAVPAVAVSIASAPKVTFSLTDNNGNAIIGFGSTAKSSTATVASYPNISFALAKLVPGTGSAPSRWVSYIVTTVPTTTAAATATRPSTDSQGTLVDNKNGTYTYTFYRDITAVKAQVAAMTLTGANVAADLDDLTYDPNLVHRLSIQISGNAPGTGTNTPTAVQTTPGVVLKNAVNVIYDFIPATGKQVTDSGRDIASTAKCNECHRNLGGFPDATSAESDATFHGGNRNKVEYCVVCHTDQRKYGRAEAVVKADGNYDGASTYRINGIAMGNNANNIHKIHMSANLTKTGYNFGGVLYEEACKFPQDIRNCTKCHDGSATATNKTAQGDNWMKVPSRMACGACHDGVNFATGKGQSLNKGYPGHIGGAQADDSKCALCHDAVTIPVYHLPVTPPNAASALHVAGGNANTNAGWIASNTSRLPAGAIAVTYDVSSVSVNASKNPVIVFKLLQNGVAKPFNDKATKTEIWDNFMGAPSVYFVFAVPQDGITAPADFNASVSGNLKTLWNGTATGTAAGTLSAIDANGYYTVTLTGVTIPASAVMLTGGLGYTYNVTNALPLTQTNLADYPVTAATAAGQTNKIGGLIVVAPNVQKVATGYTARRPIVEDARCNKCHQELGPFTEEAFHAGQRNDGTTCSWCHTPNRTSSGWSADSTSFVHGIHAAAKREQKFSWHAASTTDGFWRIGYPGILNDCETCHLPNTYDFSSAASTSALPNRQYKTVATGKLNGTSTATALAAFSISPYVTADNVTDYGAGFAYAAATGVITPAAGTTLVSSPIATVCFACHDSALARQHMENEGGSIYKPRATALAKVELCMQCHSSTSAFGLGIANVHKR